jgi:hypothetical protein
VRSEEKSDFRLTAFGTHTDAGLDSVLCTLYSGLLGPFFRPPSFLLINIINIDKHSSLQNLSFFLSPFLPLMKRTHAEIDAEDGPCASQASQPSLASQPSEANSNSEEAREEHSLICFVKFSSRDTTLYVSYTSENVALVSGIFRTLDKIARIPVTGEKLAACVIHGMSAQYSNAQVILAKWGVTEETEVALAQTTIDLLKLATNDVSWSYAFDCTCETLDWRHSENRILAVVCDDNNNNNNKES